MPSIALSLPPILRSACCTAVLKRMLMSFFILIACTSCKSDAVVPTAELPKIRETAQIDGCTIAIIKTNMARDWMPIQQRQGPDGGGPLVGVIKFKLDNSAGSAITFKFVAVVYDQAGNDYPVTVVSAYDNSAYNIWNRSLAAGESKIVELYRGDGPYLPVRSKVFAVIIWIAQNGHTASVRTPEVEIERTS